MVYEEGNNTGWENLPQLHGTAKVRLSKLLYSSRNGGYREVMTPKSSACSSVVGVQIRVCSVLKK